jgi:hypothetical protein
MAQRSSPSPVLTAREVSSRESLFNCVTAFQSSSYRFGSKANFFRALLQRFGNSINSDKPIVRAVISLFFPCSPSDVSNLIRQVVIDSVNSVLRARLRAYMLVELLELIKRRNNNSAFIAVRSNFYRLIGVDTSTHHAVPTVPLGGVSHPVSFHLLSSAQASALSTGRGFISSNFRFARAGFSSAVANASIDFPLFRVRLDQFFYGQLFMSITRLKHQFIVFDISSQVQAGSI